MQQDSFPAGVEEPFFELPPRLGHGAERRMTARAASFEGAFHEFRDNAVTLELSGDAATVIAVGGAVSRSFGLDRGRLGSDSDKLAGVLNDACATLRVSGAVVAFEAAVPTRGAACVLLRGVLLPTHRGAEAVLSWKEVLGEDATARLRAELLQAFAAPRAQPVDAFAR